MLAVDQRKFWRLMILHSRGFQSLIASKRLRVFLSIAVKGLAVLVISQSPRKINSGHFRKTNPKWWRITIFTHSSRDHRMNGLLRAFSIRAHPPTLAIVMFPNLVQFLTVIITVIINLVLSYKNAKEPKLLCWHTDSLYLTFWCFLWSVNWRTSEQITVLSWLKTILVQFKNHDYECHWRHSLE